MIKFLIVTFLIFYIIGMLTAHMGAGLIALGMAWFVYWSGQKMAHDFQTQTVKMDSES